MMYIANTESKFPVECLEEIFHHLEGEELLKCTLVCPDWNECIGLTRSCMKKIFFKLICWHRMADHETKVLLTSSRKYMCLKLTGNFSESARKLLLPIGRRWTCISAEGLDFKTEIKFLDFLRTFESSVERLEFSFGRVKSDSGTDFMSADLQFP